MTFGSHRWGCMRLSFIRVHLFHRGSLRISEYSGKEFSFILGLNSFGRWQPYPIVITLYLIVVMRLRLRHVRFSLGQMGGFQGSTGITESDLEMLGFCSLTNFRATHRHGRPASDHGFLVLVGNNAAMYNNYSPL
jgi:hypothetical protein